MLAAHITNNSCRVDPSGTCSGAERCHTHTFHSCCHFLSVTRNSDTLSKIREERSKSGFFLRGIARIDFELTSVISALNSENVMFISSECIAFQHDAEILQLKSDIIRLQTMLGAFLLHERLPASSIALRK